jgi:hypothetical protein
MPKHAQIKTQKLGILPPRTLTWGEKEWLRLDSTLKEKQKEFQMQNLIEKLNSNS